MGVVYMWGEISISAPLRSGSCPKAFWSQDPILSYQETEISILSNPHSWVLTGVAHFMLLGSGNQNNSDFYAFQPKSHSKGLVILLVCDKEDFPLYPFHNPYLRFFSNSGWVHTILFFLTKIHDFWLFKCLVMHERWLNLHDGKFPLEPRRKTSIFLFPDRVSQLSVFRNQPIFLGEFYLLLSLRNLGFSTLFPSLVLTLRPSIP